MARRGKRALTPAQAEAAAEEVRRRANERQRRHREKVRRQRDGVLDGHLQQLGELAERGELDALGHEQLHPSEAFDGDEAGQDQDRQEGAAGAAEQQGGDAAAMVASGSPAPRAAATDAGRAVAQSRAQKDQKDARKTRRARGAGAPTAPYERASGWVRAGQAAGIGMSTSQIRDIARRIIEVDLLPYLQELIVDTKAKDQDRLRAGDMAAKISVGYITPDMMNAEDAPDLPPPIFQTSEGELPGGEAAAPSYDDADGPESPETADATAAEGTAAAATASGAA